MRLAILYRGYLLKMKKQNKGDKEKTSIYDHIELVNEDNDGHININWDEVEKNYSNKSASDINTHSHHHRHHHSSRHSSSGHSSSGHSSRHSSGEHSSRHSHHHHRHHHSSNSSDKKKWSTKKKIIVIILIILLSLILSAVSAFFILRYLGKRKLVNNKHISVTVPKNIDYESNGKIVYYKGHKYQFNDSIATILFMGIDNRKLESNATAGNAGQADALYLFTYDTDNGKIKVLSLNRDTMTDVGRYDAKGNYYDTHQAQLCLAYAYGDGKHKSAQNQITAVRRLLYNVPINSYYAIDLSAIKIINDDIGGVRVTPQYTFKEFTKGQPVLLKGDLTEDFVRYRDISLLDDNLRRMTCQRDYLTSFSASVVPAIKKDLGLPVKLYNDSSKFTVTDLGVSDLTYISSQLVSTYDGFEILKTDGKYVDADKDEFAEFKIDKTKLFETILSIFYKKIS